MLSVAVVICLLGFSAARANEGVLEINQACAVNTGCFAGDPPGFPVTITAAGSYRLTSNLDVRSMPTPENSFAITITSDDTTLDLNGFALLGPVACVDGGAFDPVTSCAPTGFGVGITALGRGVVIRKGQIRGMGGRGISCSNGCRIEGVIARENGAIGFVNENEDAWILRSVADRNGSDGFFVNGQVEGNLSTRNAGRGFHTNPESRVVGNQSLHNGDDGMRCHSCLLLDNVIADNGGVGVAFSGQATYGRNLIDGNALGEISGSALAVDANRCGLIACP